MLFSLDDSLSLVSQLSVNSSIHPPKMKVKRVSKAQRMSMDRISTLPETIIETILCLLPIEEAARTSILSTEWRYKWTKIPKLVFHEFSTFNETTRKKQLSDIASAMKNMNSRCKTFYAIHQVLLLRRGPIQEFALLYMSADHTFFEIDQIILHLSMNHTLKKLNLNFDNCSSYVLPSYLFSLHHLTELHLEYCYIDHEPIFNGFGSLTSLSLSRVGISKESLLHLLSNCPSLKTLYLFLHVENLNGCISIMDLFKCLPMIEHLTTWGETVPLLEAPVPEELPASLIHLKYCSIEEMDFNNNIYGLTFLAVLMKCSPNLEKIKLEIGSGDLYDESVEFEDFSAVFEEYSDVWLEHLNELNIIYFGNSKQELEFVKFVLARSPNLKKVILSTYIDNKNEELKLLRILLGAPRASPVQIVVKNRG